MKKALRKVIAIIICIAFMLSATGCGKTEYVFDTLTGDLPLATDWTWTRLKYSLDPDDEKLYPYDGYKQKYEDYPFFTDQKDAITYFMNSMFQMYTNINLSSPPYVDRGVETERYDTHVLGTSAWWEWLATIKNWTNNGQGKEEFKELLKETGIMANGYVYCWYEYPHWPDIGFSNRRHSNYHYDGTFNFIIAVASTVLWENSLGFLSALDEKDVGFTDFEDTTCHAGEDVGVGKTVGQKLDLAVSYILNDLHGKDGLIILDENCNDGNNLGKVPTNSVEDDSVASNYWDNIPFGYKDAYENIRFYQTLDYLVRFETFRGNNEKAEYYKNLMVTAKQKFNDTFWVEKTKRYSGTVDVNGVVRDYGFTFINTEAVTMGLAPEDRAKHIYAWLDGLRIVEGDTSQGADIYNTYKSGGIAPRSNTVDLAIDGWWHSNNGSMSLSEQAQFGYHVENGGMIMYTEYHDLMGRIKYISPDNALKRMYVIATEYAKDELFRDPLNKFSRKDTVLGIINEFPETGLVPTAWLYGFVGVSINAHGIDLNPSVPTAYDYVGVKDLFFGGKNYTVTAYKDGKVKIDAKTDFDLIVNLKDAKGVNTVSVKVCGENGQIIETFNETANGGYFKINLRNYNAAKKSVIIDKAS